MIKLLLNQIIFENKNNNIKNYKTNIQK